MSTIRYEDVSLSFGDNHLLTDLNLEIADGDFVSIVGSSGSGKTTIMKMINGLILPDSGRVLIDGENVADLDLVDLRRHVGYSIQGNVLFPHLTVEENIGYVLSLMEQDPEEISQRVGDLLDTFQLPDDIRDRMPNEISGGQAQRVGIARAYASSPKVLLMDEPFGAVDAITRYQLQKDLKHWHEKLGLTIVFITHDIREALSMSTKVLVLHDGVIQQFATPAEIKDHPAEGFVSDLMDMSD
ncbi:ABC transporter ATP-binding protein [Corynebacterium sp. ES2794-CONJ1]|uniref:ATP-binding cassette domain-containing protein n=1 Tax=unclassified Corynebacterium TaxID=2624378 RepID=UPI002168932F|nr:MULTISPECIES: ABC transporter ATP-binding protein [unclassified Corynebacterium]MCS4489456.1 ABC transporter ATP-binding protein [Corynebacterium sp. ES2775-CONJ]MCS4491533.1 ABC transporter ATP-binding protein [Corynebacterium sp. ES2715-CONJ3]MCS4531367.1 ABC transporter ATP-binding protein [Corynebacterium sp. ES2730-CONJ]MCU9518754.1 ABC transporter ATP-binding protein [Corynebacterium sp. ES2794-CONJ1]